MWLRFLIFLSLIQVIYSAVQCYIGQKLFRGRRTFVSGLLLNAKSAMVLCCASLSTRIEMDGLGREKCEWREPESIAVVGPSVRTNPVLAANHYIRNILMNRDGDSRVDVSLEVCQYTVERDHCDVDRMDEASKRRFNLVNAKLEREKLRTGKNSKVSGDVAISSKKAEIIEPKPDDELLKKTAVKKS
ncbi:hypothetical protein WR25_13997 [Diploscapter pachys]|uniref:ZP domain-containing protein n=1 Tax=Diploscapter pachys TaxID=2018661 RepID=A0A2A2KVG6_9BILA|nr:hypothetical protein WR25_13997 [Diploscapter pachys]